MTYTNEISQKVVTLDAGFPMAVIMVGESAKSIAAYTPGMLIDALRERAKIERSRDNDGAGMMMDAAATMLEDVIKNHYGTGSSVANENVSSEG